MKNEEGITVAELIKQLKKLPQDMFVYREEVDDFGWREEVLVKQAVITPIWESQAYYEWTHMRPLTPITNKTHCVTFD